MCCQVVKNSHRFLFLTPSGNFLVHLLMMGKAAVGNRQDILNIQVYLAFTITLHNSAYNKVLNRHLIAGFNLNFLEGIYGMVLLFLNSIKRLV